MAGNANSGGRNAKSRGLHLLQGTFRRGRHSEDSIEAPKGRPVPPKRLTGDAKAEWNKMIGRLEQLGSLSVVDDAALYQHVQLYAQTEQTMRDRLKVAALANRLAKALNRLQGRDLLEATTKVESLTKLAARLNVQERQGRLAIKQYLVEFGITTTSRVRVRVELTDTPIRKAKERFFEGTR